MRKKVNKKERKAIMDHLDHHVLRFYCKTHHISHHGHHHFMHTGELIIVMLMGFMSLIFAGSIGLPNNSTFVYPLQQVSTYECRALMEPRENLQEDCKISLPKIQGAQYENQKDNPGYTSIYTVLRAAPYDENRDQRLGAHAGVDIASARGTPLYSIGDGEITYAGRQNGYGNVVKIKYLYQGKYVHAIYAHMDAIDVKAGQSVSAGVKIGTIGNSGNTFGALGGYHVHFELTDDNHGRPAYGYLGCADLDKGHRTIIDNGLCRSELFTNTYDPIYVFENQTLDIPKLSIQSRSTYESDEEQEQKENDQIPTQNENDDTEKQESGKKNDSPLTTEKVLDEIIEQKEKETPAKNTEDNDKNTENEQKQDEDTDKKENTQEDTGNKNDQEHQSPSKDSDQKDNKNEEPSKNNKDEEKFIFIPEKEITKETELFLKKRNIYINERTDNIVNYIQPTKIELVVEDKNDEDNKYIGVLPFSIQLVSSSSSVITDFSNIQLLKDGTQEIKITSLQGKDAIILIQLNNETIGKLFINH